MIERPCRRSTTALLLGIAALAVIGGCDNTVNIKTLTIRLQEIDPVGASYTLTDEPGSVGASCDVNQDSFDLQLLLLTNTRDRNKMRLIRDGDLLDTCTLVVGEGDDPNACYLNSDSITIDPAYAQRLSKSCVRDTDCDDGWTCHPQDKVCQAKIELSVIPVQKSPSVQDFAFVVNGKVSTPDKANRVIALVLDNSGSLRGDDSNGDPTQRPTDPTDVRFAAVKTLLDSLDAEKDRVGLFSLAGTGSNAVSFDSLSHGGEEFTGGGFYSLSQEKEGQSILLRSIEDLAAARENGGTPIWDGIAEAAQQLRDNADLDNEIPSIIVFTDGYKKQDLPRDAGAGEEYGSAATSATLGDVLAVVQDDDQPIPVYIVHLENTSVVTTAFGRDRKLEELACASGGAYYRVEQPSDVKGPFDKFLQYVSFGHYLMRVSYQDLQSGRFPAGEDYAIHAVFSMKLENRTKTFTLGRGQVIQDSQRTFDTRVFVTKP